MIKKKYISILILSLFLNMALISVSAQEETTWEVEIDGDINPEFIIHWRYSDFPDNIRADHVVSLVGN